MSQLPVKSAIIRPSVAARATAKAFISSKWRLASFFPGLGSSAPHHAIASPPGLDGQTQGRRDSLARFEPGAHFS